MSPNFHDPSSTLVGHTFSLFGVSEFDFIFSIILAFPLCVIGRHILIDWVHWLSWLRFWSSNSHDLGLTPACHTPLLFMFFSTFVSIFCCFWLFLLIK